MDLSHKDVDVCKRMSDRVIGSVGYEKRSVADIANSMRQAGLTRLLDVREKAWSMRPDFRRTALSEALASSQIAYLHCKYAGNPFRPHKGEQMDWMTCRDNYLRYLEQDPSIIERLATLAQLTPSALMCYELSRHHCHRGVILTELERRGFKVLEV